MQHEIEDLVGAVEAWQIRRIPLATKGDNGGFNKDGLYEFAETMNALTKRVISLTGRNDPEFWSAWLEIGQNASALTTAGAKVIVDKIDRTNL